MNWIDWIVTGVIILLGVGVIILSLSLQRMSRKERWRISIPGEAIAHVGPNDRLVIRVDGDPYDGFFRDLSTELVNVGLEGRALVIAGEVGFAVVDATPPVPDDIGLVEMTRQGMTFRRSPEDHAA